MRQLLRSGDNFVYRKIIKKYCGEYARNQALAVHIGRETNPIIPNPLHIGATCHRPSFCFKNNPLN
ncbi:MULTISPECIES: hypothetical protein [Bacillus cereus group]|uniref:Uncharacterized protein n=1 Tax=Bacillus cereus TaxID=1396 RepID=A0ABD7DEL2_BACCE|nr:MULTISPECIES: hypothetical protein [Bacillus cereus group]MED2791397.1 hypothetical protein [Bacillus wiedmannii]QRY15096.1 hypothetical protein JTF64_24535 [Bacillus cereus]